jgi:REP element-mobilizing transposase RayT
MARPWRIEYEGAFYHVMSRGNEQRDVFFDETDRFTFLKVLSEMSQRFEVDIFAYVLMANHYHLLIKTQQANLSKAMQWLGVTYTCRFNLKHNRCGHLFQGRFKSILVQNDAYLLQLSCYIHRNPTRAKTVRRLAQYRWSSYPAYAYGKEHPGWLQKDLILSQFNVEDKHKAYREKVQRYAEEEKSMWENFRHGMFFGSKKFVNRIREKYLSEEIHAEIPQQKLVKKDYNPQIIINQAAKILGCRLKRFRRSSRIAESDKDNRDLLIYLLWQTGLYTNQKIGQFFGLSYSAISQRVKIFRIKAQNDKKTREKFNRIKSQIKM